MSDSTQQKTAKPESNSAAESKRDGKRSSRGLEAGHDTKPGILGRIAESAAHLSGSVSRGGAQGAAALTPGMLAEAKSGRQEESNPMSQEWVAESSSRSDTTAATAEAPGDPVAMRPGGSAAALFREAARASAKQRSMAPAAEEIDSNPSHNEPAILGPASTGSHQVSLAEGLDGRSVTEFLAHSMPTSMSIGDISGPTVGARLPARPHGPHQAGIVETTDPVAYLQGATYAADMESSDHQVPQVSREDPVARMPHASPASLAKSWDEHGASVLEEWELNEAWDRAWMDTAWTSARKREKTANPEPVQPSSKNLSNLLKPRI
ncbi:hypothetical protein LPJ70_000556 [Coemansia sp. RSA 2708]|nr:hypothetical protein LPJ70_000556 [Coemansia sp. RSA 2708]